MLLLLLPHHFATFATAIAVTTATVTPAIIANFIAVFIATIVATIVANFSAIANLPATMTHAVIALISLFNAGYNQRILGLVVAGLKRFFTQTPA